MSDVRKDRDELRGFQRRNRRERDRERRNWRAYDATEFGQYDEQALAVLIQEGRPPTSFNILKRYIDTITGSILADGYDIHYETELGDENNAAILFNELYMEDRDLGNFLGEFLEMVRAGFIYRGWMEMFIDRTRDPRGRVGLRYTSADRIVADPDWTTHRVKDNKAIYVNNWMAPQQIFDRFKKKTPEIQAAIQRYELAKGGDGEISCSTCRPSSSMSRTGSTSSPAGCTWRRRSGTSCSTSRPSNSCPTCPLRTWKSSSSRRR
jgi:hypothetical protein